MGGDDACGWGGMQTPFTLDGWGCLGISLLLLRFFLAGFWWSFWGAAYK